MVDMLGRPGNIWTVLEPETISFEFFGRVMKSRMLRMSRRLGIRNSSSIHGRTHSNASVSRMIHTRVTRLVAMVPSLKPFINGFRYES